MNRNEGEAMSDLISRKKVISILEQLEEHSLSGKMDISNAIYLLEIQLTAYDIYKVVEELEEAKHTICLSDDDLEHYQNGIDRAIEIVKHGCASDDVCEWEKGSSGYVGYPAFYSKCCTTNGKGLEMQTNIIADWKYCPYCGKKIKVIGD